MKFRYKSKGSADDWTEDVIEAENEADAQEKLDKLHNVFRDEDGNQTNSEMIQVVILGEDT